MFPRWHILSGAVFTTVIWVFIPKMPVFYLTLIFLSSFLIDFDHYTNAVFETKKWGLKNALEYHRKKFSEDKKEIAAGIKRKNYFHIFHTVEFHVLVGFLSFLWVGFFYVFMGMVFHSFLDVFAMLSEGVFYSRDLFFFNWVRRRKFKKN